MDDAENMILFPTTIMSPSVRTPSPILQGLSLARYSKFRHFNWSKLITVVKINKYNLLHIHITHLV